MNAELRGMAKGIIVAYFKIIFQYYVAQTEEKYGTFYSDGSGNNGNRNLCRAGCWTSHLT